MISRKEKEYDEGKRQEKMLELTRPRYKKENHQSKIYFKWKKKLSSAFIFMPGWKQYRENLGKDFSIPPAFSSKEIEKVDLENSLSLHCLVDFFSI